MSKENVEILRRAVEAFDRGADEEWIAAWQTDAELYDFIELPDVRRPYRGREGVRRWGANVRSVLGDFQMTPQAFTAAGDAVLMDLDVRGVGEQSGFPVGMNIYILAWIRDGKIARTRAFLDREQALKAMSEENVELTYRGIDIFNRRDLGEFLAVMDEEVRADPLLAGIDGGYHGHDGIRRWWKTLLDLIPDFTVELIEVRDYGDDWVLSVVRIRGHGAESDAPFEETTWFPVRIRQGKFVWWGNYPTEAEALAAVGLSE